MKAQKEENFAVFHTGRGGRFHNPGYVSFEGVYSEQAFIQLLYSKGWIYDKNRDKRGRFCKPYYHDGGGNFVAEVGDRVFDFDGYYNRYELKPLNELDVDDFCIIFSDDKYIDNDICQHIDAQMLGLIINEFDGKWQSSFDYVIRTNKWKVEKNEDGEIIKFSDGNYMVKVVECDFDKKTYKIIELNNNKNMELTKDLLVNLFSTATYGSEWLNIETLKSEKYLDDKFDNEYLENRCREERWADRLLNGGTIVCLDYYDDIDDENVARYEIKLEKFKNGLEKAQEIIPRDWADFVNDEDDYYTCNNIMQVIIFGEVIY